MQNPILQDINDQRIDKLNGAHSVSDTLASNGQVVMFRLTAECIIKCI